MTTQMFFVLAKANDVLLIPTSALGKRLRDQDTDAGQAYQITVNGQSGPEIRTVIVSISDRMQAAVVEGLAEGDIVIPPKSAAKEKAETQRIRMPRL